jgi:hypothetical protein
MKIPEYLVGFLEASGFYLLSLSTSSTFLPLVLVLAAKAILSEELWLIPTSLFTVQNVKTIQTVKIAFGASLKLLILVLTLHLSAASAIM